jgi:oxygen-independent coproporphyrinogen-3 oxidase
MNQADEELNNLVLNNETGGRKNLALGIYIHVPFCSTTCDFCAFYQEKPSKIGIESYFRGLRDEFDRFSPNREISTVFIGGGTPGLLKADELKELCSLFSSHDLSPDVEWSIELAPSEITPEKLDVLRKGGVNRISLGVQTFNPKFMDALGRQHPVKKTFEAYQWIRQAGFDSVNLDLLFGAPGQSLQDWEDDLAQAVELAPDHLSTYCLTFEEDTAMFVRLSQGKVKIDPEREAEFYEFAWDYLPRHGFEQYEVSNYAKPGHACQHNLNTWAMNEWIGYGPSACTQFQGVRRKNIANLEEWADGMQPGNQPKFMEQETLSSTDFAQDAVLFGLRMNRGISIPKIAEQFGIPIDQFSAMAKFFDRLVSEGLATQPSTGSYALTKQGRILCDAIACDLPELGSAS